MSYEKLAGRHLLPRKYGPAKIGKVGKSAPIFLKFKEET